MFLHDDAGSPRYDNIMLWLTRLDMVGVNMNNRLAPKHVWPAAHEDLAVGGALGAGEHRAVRPRSRSPRACSLQIEA
jgi:hypothetical protein